MKTIVATIEGVSPLGFSRAISSLRNTGEGHDDYEQRTWRERMHIRPSGRIFIPGPMVKKCLENVAKYLSESVPGKGKATYTKNFKAGVSIFDDIELPNKAADVPGVRVFVPSDGKSGGGSRVWKTFPVIQEWTGDVKIVLFDPLFIAKPDKVVEYLEHAGKFIGIGTYRPQNGGNWGRFSVKKWKVVEV